MDFVKRTCRLWQNRRAVPQNKIREQKISKVLNLQTRFWCARKFIHSIYHLYSRRRRIGAPKIVLDSWEVRWSYWRKTHDVTWWSLDLFALEDSDNPTSFQTLGFFCKMPQNFVTYASMIRGYISVPTTANYVFNLTATTKVFLLKGQILSTNKIKRAEVPGLYAIDQHMINTRNRHQLPHNS
jgi:hypothetical protein